MQAYFTVNVYFTVTVVGDEHLGTQAGIHLILGLHCHAIKK